MFLFLKYIQPLWYYRFVFLKKGGEFDLVEGIFNADISQIQNDDLYESEQARKMNQGYQALKLGFIPEEEKLNGNEEIELVKNVADNYRFVAKYFPRNKLYYCLVLRLVTLNNPFKEIIGFLRALKVNKLNIYENHLEHSGFHEFHSNFIQLKPLVSIVIPTLNRYSYLSNVLNDLQKQDYDNFEVIICDQSDIVDLNFYRKWNLKLQVIEQKEKALWMARNNSIRVSKSEFILLTEDDVLLPSNWISNHLKCLDYFDCDISAGVFFPEGKTIEKSQSYFKLADHLATGNVCFKKSVFEKIGLFDRQFEKMRMGDGEFGLRAFLFGLKSVSNPFAYCIDVKAPTGGLREMGSWDSLRPTKLFAPRPVPSVLYLSRKYFGTESSIYYLIQNIPFSFIPYKFKKNKVLKLTFLMILPLLFPLMVLVVSKSWRKSTEMLNQGAKIDFLEA